MSIHAGTGRTSWLVASGLAIALLLSSLAGHAEEGPTGPNYVQLEPEFTLNYGTGERLKYVQLSITLEVSDDNAALEVNAHSDKIRHTVIMQFGNETEETLRDLEGRERVRERLLQRLREVMVEETGDPMIQRVLFTSIVVQG